MSNDEIVRETLVDCLASFVSHGDQARAAADYILSDASGLLVTERDAGTQNPGRGTVRGASAGRQMASVTAIDRRRCDCNDMEWCMDCAPPFSPVGGTQ